MATVTAEQDEARVELRKMLAPGETVYTILRHVSKSGMTRDISCVIVRDGEPIDISWKVARALGWRFIDDSYAVRVGGAGMDMGFHLVYSLAYALFYGTPEAEASGDSAGYMLSHRWL